MSEHEELRERLRTASVSQEQNRSTIFVLLNEAADALTCLLERVKRLEEWKCEHGGCQCEPPEGVTVKYESGGLFPQVSGWYASNSSSQRDSRHGAIQAARRALASRPSREGE